MSVEAAPVCYRHTNREAHIRCQRCERPICPDCMQSAAVGFQCPECVREGKRSVRQGRPLSLGARGVPVVTYALIGLNIIVFAALHLWRPLLDAFSLHTSHLCDVTINGQWATLAGVSAGECRSGGGHYAGGVAGGQFWQPVTSVFAHWEIWHIAGNMLSLWMIGPLVEASLGRIRYLVAYLVCGLAGSALVLAVSPPAAGTLGASGAIFGLLGILVVLFLKKGLPLQQLGAVVLLNFFITFTVPNISWQGHVGGFIAGLVIGALFAYAPRLRRMLR
jgi:membrane associated rhomboid family serine protease